MTRLCVIGNSHVAMLAAAAKDMPHRADISFFAMPKLSARDVTLDQGKISAGSADLAGWLSRFGTDQNLDLGTFDAVVIVGLSASLYPAARITQTHIVTGWPTGLRRFQTGLDKGDQTKLNPPVTRATYRAILTAINNGSLAHTIVTELRKTSDTPAFIIAQPFPSEALLQADDYPVIRKIIRHGNGDALAEDLKVAGNISFGHLTRTTLVVQPAETVTKGCLTKEAFMRGALRLGLEEPQPAKDMMHGNSDLGRQFLDQVMAAANGG